MLIRFCQVLILCQDQVKKLSIHIFLPMPHWIPIPIPIPILIPIPIPIPIPKLINEIKICPESDSYSYSYLNEIKICSDSDSYSYSPIPILIPIPIPILAYCNNHWPPERT